MPLPLEKVQAIVDAQNKRINEEAERRALGLLGEIRSLKDQQRRLQEQIDKLDERVAEIQKEVSEIQWNNVTVADVVGNNTPAE